MTGALSYLIAYPRTPLLWAYSWAQQQWQLQQWLAGAGREVRLAGHQASSSRRRLG
jgi:hypothetical protein